ncbi:MAG: hypothetical protein ACT4QB_09325 [Gammaproteobacteria bacterium]
MPAGKNKESTVCPSGRKALRWRTKDLDASGLAGPLKATRLAGDIEVSLPPEAQHLTADLREPGYRLRLAVEQADADHTPVGNLTLEAGGGRLASTASRTLLARGRPRASRNAPPSCSA